MRSLLALMISGALVLSCGEANGGDAGAGGSGGVGGTAGQGGAGGGGDAEPSQAYVVVLPIPPCENGAASSYSVENILVGSGELKSSFPNCAEVPVPAGENFTIMCPMDEDHIDYMITLTRDGPNGVRANGQIAACNGFLLRDVRPARDEVVVDVFVAPAPPCKQGIPSNYMVDVFVDGASDPVFVTGEFGECTGGIDSPRNTITCPNDGPSIPYSITLGEGLDWEVTVNGTWETCGGFLLR